MPIAMQFDVQFRAILCIVVGMIAFSLQDAVIKWISGT